MEQLFRSLESFFWPVLALVAAVGVALLFHWVLFRSLRGLASREGFPLWALRISALAHPVRWILVLVAARLVVDPIEFSPGVEGLFRTLFGLTLTALIAWLLLKASGALLKVVAHRYQVDVKDNLRARTVHTQLVVIHRILVVIIVIIALASMLMTFPKVRQLGTALFASAGILGIVVGLAAQKTIGMLIAGLQIAFTQPIRIDDVLIVEGEWGRVEEITLTYVVLRIWDLRRLIVPITYFIEKPFQNWTRVSADILGSVSLHVDHTVPTQAVRAELERLLEASPLWDRKVCGLQVTGTSERTVELRALMSASDASRAWDLRCQVREQLLDFLRTQYPHAFPRVRATLEGQTVC